MATKSMLAATTSFLMNSKEFNIISLEERPNHFIALNFHELPELRIEPVNTEHSENLDCPFSSEWINANSVSTYPIITQSNGKTKQEGDPIADACCAYLYHNACSLALADGCNWGERPMTAAKKATHAFTEYMNSKVSAINDTKEAGHFLLRAFSEAHNNIINGVKDIWDAGTTTLLGGMLFKLDSFLKSSMSHSWGFLVCSVGDCKAFHWSVRKQQVTDVTAGNRLNVIDNRDPGGRLGPYIKQGNPDLRNLRLYYMPCEEDDLIIVVSDGVHDNLDPELLGLLPQDLGYRDVRSWSQLSPEQTEECKCKHRNQTLKEIITSAPQNYTTKDVTKLIIDHCIRVTKACREYMEKNPNQRQPADYKLYPGKMDHTTCVTLQVTCDFFSRQESKKEKRQTKKGKEVE